MTELSLEAFAETLAQIEKVRDLARVLASANLSGEEWEAAKSHWGEAMVSSPPLRARFHECYARPRSRVIEATGQSTAGAEDFVPAPASPGPEPRSRAEPGLRDRELPTYLRETALPGEQPDDVESTQFLPVLVLGPALPFEGSTSLAKLAELKRDAAIVDGAAPTSDDDPQETLEIRSPLLQESAGTGTFRDAISPIAVPVLTTEQYAQLQAKLSVRGEAHEPTWREFQISSSAVKRALVARFDAYFAREPQAREDFAKRFEQLVLKARRHTIRLGGK